MEYLGAERRQKCWMEKLSTFFLTLCYFSTQVRIEAPPLGQSVFTRLQLRTRSYQYYVHINGAAVVFTNCGSAH
uniref:Uncharacterized protein n=1 Tax=Arundo donax TaxID=35708 RepID=A0A0A9FSW9_ARUDO